MTKKIVLWLMLLIAYSSSLIFWGILEVKASSRKSRNETYGTFTLEETYDGSVHHWNLTDTGKHKCTILTGETMDSLAYIHPGSEGPVSLVMVCTE